MEKKKGAKDSGVCTGDIEAKMGVNPHTKSRYLERKKTLPRLGLWGGTPGGVRRKRQSRKNITLTMLSKWKES